MRSGRAERTNRRLPASLPPPPLRLLVAGLVLVVSLLLAIGVTVRAPGPREAGLVESLLAPEEIVRTSFVAPQSEPIRPQPAAAAEQRPEPGANARLLGTVRDKTRAIPKGAYFHLLELALRTPVQELEAQAIRNPSLAELVRYPDRFRGKVVQLDGYVRRVTLIDPGPNRLGVRSLYECAVFSDELDRNPWIFVVLHVPEAMPKGDNLSERVTATGFFLKLWAYRAGDGLRFAPLLIGPRLVWHPAPESRTGPISVVLFVLLLGLVAVFAAVLWWSARSVARSTRVDRSTDVERFAELDQGSPEEFLQELERQPETPDASAGQSS